MRPWKSRQRFSFVEILCAPLNNQRALTSLSCSDRRCRLFRGCPHTVGALTFFSRRMTRSVCVLQFIQFQAKFFSPSNLFLTVAISLVMNPALMDGFISMLLCLLEGILRSIMNLLRIRSAAMTTTSTILLEHKRGTGQHFISQLCTSRHVASNLVF